MGQFTIRTRRLGRTGLDVSALGLGCWPIGGSMVRDGEQVGYTGVDDAESLRAVRAAVDLGVTLFDTADAYGAGHSERLLGQALAAHPEVRVATKFGNTIDEATRQLTGQDTSARYARDAVHASLRRLRRERIDLYQLHTPDVGPERAVRGVLTRDGRSLAQGALAWIWADDDRAVPLPGFRTVAHVTDTARALRMERVRGRARRDRAVARQARPQRGPTLIRRRPGLLLPAVEADATVAP